MKHFLKKLSVFYVVIGLMLTPFSGYAATKKPRKSTTVSTIKHHSASKSKSSRLKVKATRSVSSKYKKTRVNVKLRQSQHAMKNAAYIPSDHYDGSGPLLLASSKALVINQNTNEVIYAKNTNIPTPIASVTKLMTAMVVLDAQLSMDEIVTITDEDVDYLKRTSSRLALGTQLTRGDLLHLALIASENRAASALASSYPGGRAKFVRDMNIKAQTLGMTNSHFADSTGLDSSNVSTAEDLVKMVDAAYRYQAIRDITTTPNYSVYLNSRVSPLTFNNTNGLVRQSDWEIGLSKTGYISEAGRCLVMQATVSGAPVIIVLLDSDGKYTRIGDANRVRKWVEHNDLFRTTEPPMNENITVGQLY